jgi:hypothetical protein
MQHMDPHKRPQPHLSSWLVQLPCGSRLEEISNFHPGAAELLLDENIYEYIYTFLEIWFEGRRYIYILIKYVLRGVVTKFKPILLLDEITNNVFSKL